jgi:divalent metal cation (Fe/Co/Zn/Cd) transporter
MAAGAWTFYNAAKKHLMDGTIDLDTATFRMSLFTSASNCATLTLSTYAGITGGTEVTEANGYSSSGKVLTSVTWGVGASASEYRWNAAALVWTASGGSISNIKYAVIWQAGGLLLCFSQLSSAQFSVTSGNTLTITPSANGIFELN